MQLSKERVKELITDGHLVQGNNKDTFIASYPYVKGRRIEFYLDSENYVYYKSKNEHVQVLTNAPLVNGNPQIVITNKPITADYDLFDIITTNNR